jgi:hypothetical protein
MTKLRNETKTATRNIQKEIQKSLKQHALDTKLLETEQLLSHY